MAFINTTDTIGVLIGNATTTTTGDLFLTLLLLFVFLLAVCVLFRLKTEWTGIVLLPYALACGSYYSQWVSVIGVIMIYLTFIITKNFIFK